MLSLGPMVSNNHLGEIAGVAFIKVLDLWERGCCSWVEEDVSKGLLYLTRWWVHGMIGCMQEECVVGSVTLFVRVTLRQRQ